MCKSLPSSALAFDLYSACPFESSPVVPAAGSAVTAPEPAVPGGVQPFKREILVAAPFGADCFDRGNFSGSFFIDDVAASGCGLDAPMWLPSGSHTGPGALASLDGGYVVVMGHGGMRPGTFSRYF